jgi:hypothetical protein
MNDGFVMSHNSESVETKEFTGLEKVLMDSELNIEEGNGKVKNLNLTPDADGEILEVMNLATKVLETPKKGKNNTPIRDCNTSYTLGSAMKGKHLNPTQILTFYQRT